MLLLAHGARCGSFPADCGRLAPQDTSATLQQQLSEQAALLSQQSSQEQELASAAQEAAREAARLNMDLQALEHQHQQEQVPPASAATAAKPTSWAQLTRLLAPAQRVRAPAGCRSPG